MNTGLLVGPSDAAILVFWTVLFLFSSLRAISAWLFTGIFVTISVGGHSLHLRLHHAGGSGCGFRTSHCHHYNGHQHAGREAGGSSSRDDDHSEDSKRQNNHDCLICSYFLQSQLTAVFFAIDIQQLPPCDTQVVGDLSPPSLTIESYDARGPPCSVFVIS